MRTKFLIIVGAGSTFSDALSVPTSKRPPLDSGFFSATKSLDHPDITPIEDYFKFVYDVNIKDNQQDSLEGVMAMLYADIHNPRLEPMALPAFRSLIRLFNQRIAETTNSLKPTNRGNLYRIICQMLDNKISPEEICIITFNQDLHIEKVLNKIQETGRATKHGRIFNWPDCYAIESARKRLSSPKDVVKRFSKGPANGSTIRVLKLHGSLNWFSTHHTKDVSKNTILNPKRPFRLTPRYNIAPDMTFTNRRKEYTFPVIIPPVTHKAGILHEVLLPLWEKAETALKAVTKIVVFGYSCPSTDFESANLISRALRQSGNLKEFHLVDPNPKVFNRYIELTQAKGLHYYRNTSEYIDHANFHMR